MEDSKVWKGRENTGLRRLVRLGVFPQPPCTTRLPSSPDCCAGPAPPNLAEPSSEAPLPGRGPCQPSTPFAPVLAPSHSIWTCSRLRRARFLSGHRCLLVRAPAACSVPLTTPQTPSRRALRCLHRPHGSGCSKVAGLADPGPGPRSEHHPRDENQVQSATAPGAHSPGAAVPRTERGEGKKRGQSGNFSRKRVSLS